MSDHLRYAGAGPEIQERVLEEIVRSRPVLMQVLEGLSDMALPDPLVASGGIYNEVWNELTGRAPLTGVKDIDVLYFDGADLSYEAEDRVIQTAAKRFGDLPVPVELRNQARVHLWFESKFGQPFPPLTHTAEALLRYASKTHSVGVRLEGDGRMRIEAPFGLDDLFSFRMVPNPVLDNRKTHETKGARAKAIWPELIVMPWPDSP